MALGWWWDLSLTPAPSRLSFGATGQALVSHHSSSGEKRVSLLVPRFGE
jgi:hypothetical protein